MPARTSGRGTRTAAPAIPTLTCLARQLAAELRSRAWLERPLSLLALGPTLRETAAVLEAEGLARVEPLPVPGLRPEERTLPCDLEEAAFRRSLPRVDVLLVADVLEELENPVAALRELADRARLLLFRYEPRSPTESAPGQQGRLADIELRILARSLGAELSCPPDDAPGTSFMVRIVDGARSAA